MLLSNRLLFQFSSQITVNEGCWLLVRGFIDNKETTLKNVSRPPGNAKAQIKNIFNMIIEEASGLQG